MSHNKKTYLTIDDFNRFINTIPKLEEYWKRSEKYHRFPLSIKQFQLLCKLMFYCALGRGEVVSLIKSNFNLQEKTLTIPGDKTHKKETTIPPNITEELSIYLETLDSNAILFPISKMTLWRYVKLVSGMANLNHISKIRKKNEVTGVHPTLFRDSYKEYMHQRGADEDLVSLKLRTFSDKGYGGHSIETLKDWESEKYELEYVAEPEGQKIEFKSTFAFNLKRFEKGEGKHWDKNVELEVPITISAMANADGGQLYLGVRDDGKIIGLDNDFELLKYSNEDEFRRRILQSIRNYIDDKTFESKLQLCLEKRSGKKICIIEIPPSSEPIFVHEDNAQTPYVRMGPKSEKFPYREFMKYWINKFYR